MRALKPPGTFRWIRGVRTFELDPERLRLQRVRAIIRSIQRDLDEGGRACVRQIMKGPELFRIELERPDWSYLRTTILDRATRARSEAKPSEERAGPRPPSGRPASDLPGAGLEPARSVCFREFYADPE